MPFFLGIDGGGTKTRCAIGIGNETSLVGRGSSSSCKVQRVGEACARDSLSAAIHEACVQAGISPGQIVHTCAGITGSARTEIARVMRDLICEIVSGEVEIIGDVEIAFEDAFGTGPGMVVIAGTGSIAYGKDAHGNTARAGGWGSAISDEGSGYWIGIEAVRLALRAHDRSENPTLLKSLMEAVEAQNIDHFIVKMNSNPPPDFAAFFPIVLSAADNGDPTANEILERGGHELANVGEIVIQELFQRGENFPVATHGGIFSSSAVLKKAFLQRLESQFGDRCKWLAHDIDPARGALTHARRRFSATNTSASNQ